MTLVATRLINTDKFAQSLRRKGIDVASKKVLVTNFEKSEQEKDLTLPPNCSGFGRIHHFNRSQGADWPLNPLPTEPASHFLGLSNVESIQVQVFQNAACSWRCWYCFVDDELLAANPSRSVYMRADELLDLYLQEPSHPPIIDLSGGQPDLVPEWTLWFADALCARGLHDKIYLWSDDNLSNDYLWRYLGASDVNRLIGYKNYGRVGCFKGFDEQSFSFNTRAYPELYSRQFKTMKRLVDTGLDVYGYVTLTASDDESLSVRIRGFVDRLQEEIHPLFPMRMVPLRIMEFTPTSRRMTSAHRRAMSVQTDAVQLWGEELRKRFASDVREKKIFEHTLMH